MATVFDVASYILERQGRMSTWKLQKLCYYAQAWHIAWTDDPLFEEDFQAWSNGPVCPELFNVHRGKYMVSSSDIRFGDSGNLTAEEKESIDIVLDGYGEREPYDLREQSHSEAPWQNARGGVPDGEPCTAVITKEAMGEYYGSL